MSGVRKFNAFLQPWLFRIVFCSKRSKTWTQCQTSTQLLLVGEEEEAARKKPTPEFVKIGGCTEGCLNCI